MFPGSCIWTLLFISPAMTTYLGKGKGAKKKKKWVLHQLGSSSGNKPHMLLGSQSPKKQGCVRLSMVCSLGENPVYLSAERRAALLPGHALPVGVRFGADQVRVAQAPCIPPMAVPP